MRFWSPASKKWLEKSLRGSKENFLKRVILDRRRYNKAVGGITKPQGVYKQQKVSSIWELDTVTTGFISSQRSYYISDDLYISDSLRELLKASLESLEPLNYFFPDGCVCTK